MGNLDEYEFRVVNWYHDRGKWWVGRMKKGGDYHQSVLSNSLGWTHPGWQNVSEWTFNNKRHAIQRLCQALGKHPGRLLQEATH